MLVEALKNKILKRFGIDKKDSSSCVSNQGHHLDGELDRISEKIVCIVITGLELNLDLTIDRPGQSAL